MSDENYVDVLYVDGGGRGTLGTRAEERGVRVTTAPDSETALERVATGSFDCVVAHHEGGGLELLPEVRERRPEVPFVLLAAEGDESVATRAFRAGATDYVPASADGREAVLDRVRAAVDGGSRRPSTQSAHLERSFRAVVRAVADASTREEVAEAACRCLADRYRFAWYARLDRERGELVPVANAGGAEWDPGTDVVTDGGVASEPALSGEVRIAPDARNDPEFVVPDPAVGAGAVVPVSHGDTVYGVLGVYAARRGAFDEADRPVLADLGWTVGHALHRVETTRHLRTAGTRLSDTLGRITDGFVSLDDDWRFTYVNDRAAEILDRDADALLGEALWEAFPEVAGTTFETEYRRAIETGEVRTFEEYYGPLKAWLEVRVYPAADGLSVYFRDVTDRMERERDLRLFRRAIDEASVGVTMTDPTLSDNPITYVNDRFESMTGYDESEVLGRNCRFLQGEDTDPETVAEIREAVEDERPVSVDVRNYRADGEAFWNHLEITPVYDETGSLVRYLGFQRDVTGRERMRRVLARLHEATAQFHHAESAAAVADATVEVASDVLDLSMATVYRYDEDDACLRPVAYSSDVAETMGTPPTLYPGESAGWEVFVDGESLYNGNVDALDDELQQDPSTPLRSALMVPMGPFGLLAAGSVEPDAYDRRTVELAEVLATVATGALDRVEREAAAREREDELAKLRDDVEDLDRVLEGLVAVHRAIETTTTRSGLERSVCERLAEVSGIELAWIGHPDRTEGRLSVDATSAPTGEHPDALSLERSGDDHPAVHAALEGEMAAVHDVADGVRDATWRQETLARGYRSVLAVPVTYGGRVDAVVALYAEPPRTFDGRSGEATAAVGRLLGLATHEFERRTALLADQWTELEFLIPDPGHPLNGLAEQSDGTFELERVDPGEESVRVELAVDGGPSPETARGLVAVEGADRPREGILALSVEPGTLVPALLAHGGGIRDLRVTDRGTRVVVETPADADVGSMLSDLRSVYPEAEFLARREPNRTPGDRSEEGPLSALTDRQREVLSGAYHEGFFEWPRDSTGEELAAAMDVASPTFHRHVRTAERKVFDALFGGD